jgi:hypothetical protein
MVSDVNGALGPQVRDSLRQPRLSVKINSIPQTIRKLETSDGCLVTS